MSDWAALTEDYEALRRGAGAVLTSRVVRLAAGPDALSFLQSQCSQDLAAIERGKSADSLLLSPEGKVDALIRVTRVGDDAFVLDFEGSDDEVMVRLTRFKLRAKVEFTLLDWSVLALRGPAVEAPSTPTGAELAPAVVPFDWNGMSGFDLIGPSGAFALNPEIRSCGSEALEACRVEAGIPLMGFELDHKTIAAEAWLVDRCVSFTKGCFTGQELVARMDARGTNVVRRLCGLVLEGVRASLPGASLHQPGQEKSVGTVTSAAWCPGLGAIGCLAYLHRSVAVGDLLELELSDDHGTRRVGVESRDLPMV